MGRFSEFIVRTVIIWFIIVILVTIWNPRIEDGGMSRSAISGNAFTIALVIMLIIAIVVSAVISSMIAESEKYEARQREQEAREQQIEQEQAQQEIKNRQEAEEKIAKPIRINLRKRIRAF